MIGVLFILSYVNLDTEAQIIHLNAGSVRGFEHQTDNGVVAEVFLAIPYATPPVGELRFEKPSPVKRWEGICDGTKFGPTCHPHVRKAALDPPPSEDCLTLNIIRPKNTVAGGSPILIWVHGGGYQIGSASLYGYKGFAEIYIPHDIIVVSIQYRLGVYGFFSSGDAHLPGNLGLFDMATAIKFIHANALNIGGDASRITVMGASAGGAAVGQLILSPVSRDYIARSIEISGTPWASWALGPNVVNNSLHLAKELGCRDDLKACMKSKTVDDINDAVMNLGYTTTGLDGIKWGPVIDGLFLKHPDELTASAPPKASIVGLCNKEASFLTIKALSPYIHSFGVKTEDFYTWDREKLVNVLKKLIRPEYYGQHWNDVIKDFIAYYVDRNEEHSYDFYLDRYTEFLSDFMFNVGATDGILARRHAGWKLYAYSLDHYNEAIWDPVISKRLKGASHVSELPYTLDIFILGQFDIVGDERIVADIVRDSFISFIKNGVPENRYANWDDVGEDSIHYISISPKPQLRKGFYNESTAFFHRLRNYGFDLITLLPTRKSIEKEEL